MRSLQPGRLLDDDRGQSVQVGAAILLAFVVIAITMYQVQVVPDQNADVEFNHNQDARQDMIDLRNAISEVGNEDTTRSVSVKMGTQYPPRSIFVNPPPPRGTLRTESIGDISIQNATVTNSDDFENETKVEDLLDSNHTTSHVFYDPDYTEFDSAPTTFVEHSLAYDSFPNGFSQSVTPQSVVNNNSITLTVLRGNVSEQGSGTFSLDPRTVSGPTDTIEIQQNNSNPITVTLPTATPDVWNETFADDPDVDVEHNPGTGTVRLVLDKSSYDLQMAMVGVGNGVPESSRYDIQGETTNRNGSGSAYSVKWSDSQSDAALADCSFADCNEDYQVSVGTEDVRIQAETIPDGISHADVDFSYRDSDGVGIEQALGTDTTFDSGSATFQLEGFDDEGVVEAFVASGGTSDSISIEVVGGLLPTITDTNSPVEEGEQLTVTATIENTANAELSDTVDLDIPGIGVVDSQSVTLGSGESQTITLIWSTAEGDIGNYDATVRTSEAGDSTSIAVRAETLPDGDVAFQDQNDNGIYDSGEPSYSTSELGSASGDIHVVRDVTSSSIDIQGTDVKVGESVEMAVQSGGTITISASETMNLTGSTLDSAGQIQLNPSGAFDGDRMSLSTDYGMIQIQGSDLGTLRNANVDSGGQIQISFEESIYMNGATIQASGQTTIGTNSGELNLPDASININAGLTISSSEVIDMSRATVQASGQTAIGSDSGILFADDASITINAHLTLTSSGDMSLIGTYLSTPNWALMQGNLGDSSNTLYVGGAEFIGNGGEFEYLPGDITVVGSPDQGSTTAG